MSTSSARTARPAFVRLLPLLAAFGLLAGCASVDNWFAHRDPNANSLNLGANPPQVARPAANPSEKLSVLPVASTDINCPPVDIAEGGESVRVGGADNESVRYQFNIGDTARECDPAGPGQAALKIGVTGDVVIGPAGSAGTYSVAAADRSDEPRQQQAGLFPDLSGRGDDRRRQRRSVPRRHGADPGAAADAPAFRRLFDHRRLRGRGRRSAEEGPPSQDRRLNRIGAALTKLVPSG